MSISIPARPRALPEPKAGPVGPGAGVLNTEYPLERYSQAKSPQKIMQRAWDMSFEVPWITLAEDAITDRFSTVDWALEDENDETIDDAYPNPDAQRAYALIERPTANITVGADFYQTDLWALTGRAMGICGSAFIFMDQLDAYAGTPAATIPIAPWRMFPEDDAKGNLIGWSIDKTRTDPGIPVRLDEILHFRLRPAFSGHFGVGLMETAFKKAKISIGLDDHISLVISAGGRLSGLLSPKTGLMEAETMLQMERDWRTVVEQSDAAKRLQLVRAPIQFDRTTLTPAEMQIRDLMDGARDDLLTIWEVPLSIVGGTTPAGLNSGDTRKYDEAAIWQGPVHHRLNVFRQVMQYQMLDRWQKLGVTVELEITEPEFDDDSPRYDLLGKSLNTPLTNAQRLGIIGFPPTGDPAIDNAILLPATIVPYAMAPAEDNTPNPTAQVLGREPDETTTAESTPAAAAAGETSKAVLPSRLHGRVAPLHASLVRYREHAMAKYTPMLRASVHSVLKAQQHDIAARLRKHAAHVEKHPGDPSIWWDKGWDAKLRTALAPRLEAMASVVVAQVHDVLPSVAGKAAPAGAVERVMARGVARVTNINDTTKSKIQDAVSRGLGQGLSVTAVADLIEGIGSEEDASALGLDLPSAFDEYRAEMIARTELMDAYNGAALGSYTDAGLNQVQAIDGDGDEECAARDGQVFDIEEADNIEDHPNGTLDWVPVIDEVTDYSAPEEGKAVAPQWAAPTINVHNDIHVPAPIVSNDVHVPTPNVVVAPAVVQNDVHVAPTPVVVNNPPPTVTVLPAKEPTRKIIDRDRNGTITGSHDA